MVPHRYPFMKNFTFLALPPLGFCPFPLSSIHAYPSTLHATSARSSSHDSRALTQSRSRLLTRWAFSIRLRSSVANAHTLVDPILIFLPKSLSASLLSTVVLFSLRRFQFFSPFLDFLPISGSVFVYMWADRPPPLPFLTPTRSCFSFTPFTRGPQYVSDLLLHYYLYTYFPSYPLNPCRHLTGLHPSPLLARALF